MESSSQNLEVDLCPKYACCGRMEKCSVIKMVTNLVLLGEKKVRRKNFFFNKHCLVSSKFLCLQKDQTTCVTLNVMT